MRAFLKECGRTAPCGRWAVTVCAAFLFGVAVMPGSAADAIVNVTQSHAYADLPAALAAARDGDTISVSGGPHVGNFIIDRRIVLRGEAMPVLDGTGKGTVLTVRAPDTVIEGFAIRGSSVSDSPYDLWGDAGVAVYGDRVNLKRLSVSGNDWGVIFFGGEGSSIRDSDISDNVRDGIRILGGKRHLVESNIVNRNLEGVSLTDWYPDREAPVLQSNDPVKLQDYIEKKANAPRAVEHTVRDNEVRGNAFYGLIVTADAHHNTLADNRVFNTGKEKPLDLSQIAAIEAGFSAITGMDVKFSRDTYGSGILLSCLAHDNDVLRNDVHDNLAHGIVIDMADRTLAQANLVHRNRTGVLVISTNAGTVVANTVSDNSEYGVRIGSDEVFRLASNDNLIVRNALIRNPVNAFDSSGRALTEAEVKVLLDSMPLPKAVKEQLLKNPAALRQWIASWLEGHKPGANRWDDGTVGNHHDDFDEPAEGFVDKDDDGISETGKPIPGGPSIDHHPLAGGKVAKVHEPGAD